MTPSESPYPNIRCGSSSSQSGNGPLCVLSVSRCASVEFAVSRARPVLNSAIAITQLLRSVVSRGKSARSRRPCGFPLPYSLNPSEPLILEKELANVISSIIISIREAITSGWQPLVNSTLKVRHLKIGILNRISSDKRQWSKWILTTALTGVTATAMMSLTNEPKIDFVSDSFDQQHPPPASQPAGQPRSL